MTRREYYQKIEEKLLSAMNEIDESVGLMNLLYHENYKEADTALKAKEILKTVLNKKFDSCAANRILSKN